MSDFNRVEPTAPIDGITSRVLGIREFLDAVEPRSQGALEAWNRLEGTPFLTATERRRELERLRALDAVVDQETIDGLSQGLCALPDLARVFRRLDAGETLRDADFFELKRFFYYALQILDGADGLDSLWQPDSAICDQLRDAIDTLHPGRAGSVRFHLADELDPTLEKHRSKLREIRSRTNRRRRRLEDEITERYGGRFDVHGRFHSAGDDEIDDDRLAADRRGYRLVDDRLESLRQQQNQQVERVASAEHEQRRRLTEFVASMRDDIAQVRDRLVDFDLRLTRIELMRAIDGCWPTFDSSASSWLQIDTGRDPGLVRTVGDRQVQPVDVRLGDDATVVLGPNMGGKSALLRLVGLVQWCAQQAMPVPAESCVVREVERIVYVGSDEPMSAGVDDDLSSFGREVRRLVEHWEGPAPGLWLLDEPCRGTHPAEGTRLAEQIARRRLEAGDRVVMSTHLPGLAEIEDFDTLSIAGLNCTAGELQQALSDTEDEQQLRRVLRQKMDYGVVEGSSSEVPRDGMAIAGALGLKLEDR